MALSDSIHSIHWDIVIRFLVVLRKRWQSRHAPIEKNGADAVLFGLHLLYFPSVSAFCAGQKSVAYMSWTESICIWGKKDKLCLLYGGTVALFHGIPMDTVNGGQ